MDERDWQIIKTLYEEKNITKTANILYLSQPALTTRIKQIENKLGVALIYRGNKGITFTSAGERAAIFALKILNETSTFKEELANLGDEIGGILRIAAPSILASYYLPQLLSKFQELYPKVTFDISIAPSSKVLGLMTSKALHFGFLRNDFGWDEHAKLLLTTNYVCAVATKPFKLEDLPNMTRIDYETEVYYRTFLDAWWNDNFKVPPKIGMQVSNLDLSKEMVFKGLGYGLLPSILIDDKPGLYSIPLCDKNGKLLARNTWLIYKKGILSTKLSRTFYEFVKECDFGKCLYKGDGKKEK
jgi:DNA-binding transcriptional LysR family regulator